MRTNKPMRAMLAGVSALTVLLAGCEAQAPGEKMVRDQCLRAELFKQCMQMLPKGPDRIGTSNDWDEVVSECGQQSAYQSLRKAAYVKPECAI